MGIFFAYDETDRSVQENFIVKSRLISGYNIADGKIICEQSQKAVDDISALALNFSARAVNAIGQVMHIKKVKSLIFLYPIYYCFQQNSLWRFLTLEQKQ